MSTDQKTIEPEWVTCPCGKAKLKSTPQPYALGASIGCPACGGVATYGEKSEEADEWMREAQAPVRRSAWRVVDGDA